MDLKGMTVYVVTATDAWACPVIDPAIFADRQDAIVYMEAISEPEGNPPRQQTFPECEAVIIR